MRNYQYNNLTVEQFNNRGVSLIIVIFAMMLLAVLGWSLAVLQSTDFEASLRQTDSERALGLAEAGAQWALQQLSVNACWRTRQGTGDINGCNRVDDDCNDDGDWVQHSLSPGQYSICCRNPDIGAGEDGDAVIESAGFVPAQADYRATRDIKLIVEIGSFDKVLQAKNLFNWTSMLSDSRINGDIQAGFYDRNGNCNPANGEGCNELGIDYKPLPPPVLPPDGSGDERTVAAEPYPLIDMAAYEAEAGSRVWPQNYTTNEANITNIQVLGGNRVDLRVDQDIFPDQPAGYAQWPGQIIRNISGGRGWLDADWRIISERINARRVRIPNDGLNWSEGDRVRIGRRYVRSDTQPGGDLRNRNLWYIMGDVLFDVREPPLAEGDINVRRTAVVAEGDIVIKGTNTINFGERPIQYPNLATQNGNIISTDEPDGPTENARLRRRDFDGLLYTQNGNIDFNYLRAESIMGNNVTLDGRVRLDYDPRVTRVTGFIWSSSLLSWQEQ